MKKLITTLALAALYMTALNAFEEQNFLPEKSRYVCIITKEYANNQWNEYTDRQLAAAPKVELKKFTSVVIHLGENEFDYKNSQTMDDGKVLDTYHTAMDDGYVVEIIIPRQKGKFNKLFKFIMDFDKPGAHSKIFTCVDMTK